MLLIIFIILLILVWIYFEYYISTTETTYNIPKIVIQTWKDHDIPAKYLSLIDNIKKHNTEYEYLFFTDNDILSFMKQHYPEYLQTYEKLPIKIQKIDFFRYVAVYHYGGVYMDLDMDGLKNMDDILQYKAVFPVDEYITDGLGRNKRYKYYYNNNQKFLLGQYAFAAEPRNEFIKLLIDNIHNNIHSIVKSVNHDDQEYVYKTTGPDYVSKIYMDYTNKSTIHILDNGKRQYFGDYAQHCHFGSWK